MLLLATLAGAAVGGIVARRVRLPGGTIVGALIGTAIVSLTVGTITVPFLARQGIFVGLGTMLGMLVTRETLRALRLALLPALFAAIAIIAGGIGIALLLRTFGIAPEGDMLATSPGALSVLTAAAIENDASPPTVALFHVVRIVLVLVTLPLVAKLLLGRRGRRDSGESATERADVDVSEFSDDDEDDVPPAMVGSTESPRPSLPLQLLLTAAGASVGAFVSQILPIDGSLLLCTTTGAALVTLAYKNPHRCPPVVRNPIQTGLGWTIGALFTPATMGALGGFVAPAVLAAVLAIGNGIVITMILRLIGQAPEGDVLATSPGAADAVSAAAIDLDANPVVVALFHTVRLLLVILSLPLQVALMQG